jgi:hypothetical protein
LFLSVLHKKRFKICIFTTFLLEQEGWVLEAVIVVAIVLTRNKYTEDRCSKFLRNFSAYLLHCMFYIPDKSNINLYAISETFFPVTDLHNSKLNKKLKVISFHNFI